MDNGLRRELLLGVKLAMAKQRTPEEDIMPEIWAAVREKIA